jgi:hypothetical protein
MMYDLAQDQRGLGRALLEKLVRKVTCIFLLGFAMTAGIFNVVYAREPYLEWFNDKYGTGGTQLDDCITCHISSNPDGDGGRNAYGDDFEKEGSDREAFGAIELWDSDDDGFSNKAEIENRTFPGDPRSVPGGDNGCFITTAFPFVSPQRIAIGAELTFRVCGTTPAGVAILIWLVSVIAVTVMPGRKRLPKRHEETTTL